MAEQKVFKPKIDVIVGDAYTNKDPITLLAVGQSGNAVRIKMNKDTKVADLFRAYEKRLSIPPKATKFIFDGKLVIGEDTPRKLNMENNDIMYVFYCHKGLGEDNCSLLE